LAKYAGRAGLTSVAAETPSFRLKVCRAERHLEELKTEIADYSKIRPYEAIRDVEADPQAYVYRARLREEPPPRIALIVGDFMHNLRSSLDHLAVALSVGGKWKRKAYFPVAVADYWQRSIETGEYADKFAAERERWHRYTGGIAEAPLAIIKALQPYKSGQDADTHPLRVLHALDNADKHRRLATLTLGLLDATTTIHDPAGGALFSQRLPGMVQDGAVVASFPFADASAEVDVHIHGAAQVAVEIAWEEGGLLKLPDGLQDLVVFVRRRVIALLEPFVF
jgi:hypothetical protein